MTSPLEGPVIYALIRSLKPNIVVETGVANGSSTTFILKALETNHKGQLFSIDMPSNYLNVKEIGWLVPEYLRKRWKLIIEDAKTALPKLLFNLKHVDIFLHDSLHTLDHVLFELKEAYNYMPKGGILIADDVEIRWIKIITQEIKVNKKELFYDLLVLRK
ncbi:MAG: class I SAM-dependent methyltransferase [Thermoprotei archaeon]